MQSLMSSQPQGSKRLRSKTHAHSDFSANLHRPCKSLHLDFVRCAIETLRLCQPSTRGSVRFFSGATPMFRLSGKFKSACAVFFMLFAWAAWAQSNVSVFAQGL